MRREFLLLICPLVVLLAGCPKRQTTARLVYAPSPAPAVETSATAVPATEAMVIEEPESAELETKPSETDPAQTAARRRTAHHRSTARTEAPAGSETDLPADPQPPAEVPALEPRESLEKQTELRRQIVATQQETQRRLTQLDRGQLTAGDHRTLEDARAFLAQSTRELDRGELMRAINLAHKAALLVSAVEQSH